MLVDGGNYKIRKSSQPDYYVALGLDLTTFYSRQKLQGVLAWLRRHGGWRICMKNAQPYLSKSQLARFSGDGVIGEFYSESDLPKFNKNELHVVNTSGSLGGAYVNTVCLDDVAIGRLAASHLLEKGFRHLCFFGQKEHQIADLRYQGMCEVAKACKSTVEAHWIDSALSDQQLAQGRLYEKSIRLIRGKLPGIFCTTDRLAYGVLEACHKLGVAVPLEAAVVGSNNDEILCQLAEPQLSSVDESAQAVGYQAAETLQAMMSGDQTSPVCHRIGPAGIRVRGSSDRLPDGPEDLGRALRFIRDHSHESINVPDVMRHVIVSRRTLETLFQKATGHGIYREILKVRIERAQELLRDTSDPILEIARQCGFQSLQRFEANFKDFSKCSAGAYRQRDLSHRI